MAINRNQLNALLRGLPPYAPPFVTQAPYVATETRVGDTVYSVPASVTPGYPGPLVVNSSLVVGGATQALDYTVQPGDVGKLMTRVDAPSNASGAATPAVSAPVTIQALQTFGGMGYFGGNVENALDYNTNRLLLNAFAEGRSDGSGGIYGSSGYAAYMLPRLGGDIATDPVSYPAGALTITGSLTAGSSVALTMGSGVGTTALAGDASDVGRKIYFSGSATNSATITAFGTTTSCTATLNSTQSSSTFNSGVWSICQPPLVFGATSGSTSMRIPTTAMGNIPLSGEYKDVNKRFTILGGVSALVTAYGDTRNCTVTIQGGTLPSTIVAGNTWWVGPDRDSNGWPRCPSTNVYASSFSYAGGYTEGNLAPSASLPDGVYHCTVKSPSSLIAPSLSGSSNCSMTTPTTPVLGGDGQYTTTFDLTVGPSKLPSSGGAANSTLVCITHNQAITFADCPRDGSYSSVGKPQFYQPALAHYSQFTYLRFMDFLGTNSNITSNWIDRAQDYAQARGHNSWEFFVSFANAIAAYPGSKLKKVHICTPPFATLAYVQSLRDFFASSGLSSSLTLIVERGNEQWNTQFKMYFNDTNLAYTEVGAVSAGYGSGAAAQIASMVGNGTTMTVTLNTPALPSFITGSSSLIAATITPNMSAWNKGTYAAPVPVTSVGTNTFAFASSVVGSLRLSAYTGDSTLTFASTAAGSGVAVSCVNATFNVGDVGLYVKVGGVYCLISGVTDATHATVTIPTGGVSSSTFAAGAWAITASGGGTVQMAIYCNPASTLLAVNGNVNLYQMVANYHARQQYLACQNWQTVRPQDKFVISTQIGNTLATFNASVYYGGGSATWAYGMCIAPYNTPTATTLDALFASMTANQPGLVSQMKSLIATCKAAGIRPMCYEGGVQFFDYLLNNDHAMQYAAFQDPRMLTQMQTLWTNWLQMGGQEWAHFTVSPASFYNSFAGIENFSDTSSPLLLGIQAANNTVASFVEVNAADSTNLYSSSTNGQYNATSGVLYAFSNIARYYTHTFTINRGRRYKFVVEGTTNAANDNVTIAIDGVTIGTPLTLPRNGSASGGAASSPSANSFVAELTSGYHALQINLAGGPANGYKRVTFVPA